MKNKKRKSPLKDFFSFDVKLPRKSVQNHILRYNNKEWQWCSMKKKLKLSKRGKNFIVSSILVLFFGVLFFQFGKIDPGESIIKKDNYYIKIDYPEIENKKSNRKVANSIKNYIDEKKEEFIELVKNLDTDDRIYDFLVTNSVSEYEGIVLVHLEVYAYTGGAHYIRDDQSYYFDKNTGKELSLNDFLESSESLDRLAERAYHHILEYGIEREMNFVEETVREGTVGSLENYLHFTFKNDGLEFLFPPYQVSCWADGEIKITIPYKELEGIIKKEYLKESEEPPINPVEKNTRKLEDMKDKKLIAFTFDDGPLDKTTNRLLDNLDTYNARVTFFILGSRVNRYSSTLIRAYEQGNQIGSHTYSHLNLYKLNDGDILKEIVNTNNEVKNIIGEAPVLLRPPYGNTNSKIKALGDMYTILWDIDPEDWKYKDKDKIAENIVKNAHDGAIVLLHDIYETSIDGALLAMEKLQEKGYAFVTIEEMFQLKNIEPDKTKSYFKF